MRLELGNVFLEQPIQCVGSVLELNQKSLIGPELPHELDVKSGGVNVLRGDCQLEILIPLDLVTEDLLELGPGLDNSQRTSRLLRPPRLPPWPGLYPPSSRSTWAGVSS